MWFAVVTWSAQQLAVALLSLEGEPGRCSPRGPAAASRVRRPDASARQERPEIRHGPPELSIGSSISRDGFIAHKLAAGDGIAFARSQVAGIEPQPAIAFLGARYAHARFRWRRHDVRRTGGGANATPRWRSPARSRTRHRSPSKAATTSTSTPPSRATPPGQPGQRDSLTPAWLLFAAGANSEPARAAGVECRLLRSRRGHVSWRFLSRKALVRSRRLSRLPLGDRDSAARLLDVDSEQARSRLA